MSRFIEIREETCDDLTGRYRWLMREAGEAPADAMLERADAEFRKLADTTGPGAPVEISLPELTGLRK